MTRTKIIFLISVVGSFLLCLAYAIVRSEKTVKKPTTTESVAQKPKSRIVLKCKEEIMDAPNIYIYEIDSVEYIVSQHGAIHPLIKKSK